MRSDFSLNNNRRSRRVLILPCMAINVNVQYNGGLLPDIIILFKKNLNASKPSEHPPQVEECLKV